MSGRDLIACSRGIISIIVFVRLVVSPILGIAWMISGNTFSRSSFGRSVASVIKIFARLKMSTYLCAASIPARNANLRSDDDALREMDCSSNSSLG